MTTTLPQRLALSALAAVCLIAATTAATAGGGAFTRGCAARDMQVLKLIEDREANHAVSAETLNAAMLTIMHARNVCHEGAVLDALAIYEGIVQSITPGAVLSSRPSTTGMR
jgi:hypothetical protein